VALLISQFEKDISGHPGLLRFSEVVNLFHEFGHVVCFLWFYTLSTIGTCILLHCIYFSIRNCFKMDCICLV